LSEQLNDLVSKLVSEAFTELHAPRTFIPGESAVPVTGKVFGQEELTAAVMASLDFWSIQDHLQTYSQCQR
jgi:CDP-4-dehydro-6-deoxyglucose reductase, E1